MRPQRYQGGGGGGMNAGMLKQVQKMQENMVKMQEELESSEYTGTAGGAVTAVVTGKHRLISLAINPEAVTPDDVEMLQDMIIAAVNDAVSKADEASEAGMKQATGGMNIPGLF